MGKKILVLGGARSGKSSFAEKKASELDEAVLYVATGLPLDDDMKRRIEKHQERRPAHWETLERYKEMALLPEVPAFQAAQVVLVDCATVMITNLMFEHSQDYDTISSEALEAIEQEISEEFQALFSHFENEGSTLIVVSNEVGLGLVPAYKLGNYFRDIAGRINQKMAAAADEVYFLISGIPMRIK